MQEMQVWPLGREDPLQEAMATHSTTLTWKIPSTGEPGKSQWDWAIVPGVAKSQTWLSNWACTTLEMPFLLFSSFSPPFKTHFILQGSGTRFSSCFSLWASLPMLTHGMQLPYSFGPCLHCLRPYLELLFYPSHHFLTCCLLLQTRLWLPEGQRWNVSSFLCIFHNLTLQCNIHSLSTCQILCSSLGKLSQLNNQEVLA